jgi:DNA-binding phage protein
MDDITKQVRRIQSLVRRGMVSQRRLAIMAKLPRTTLLKMMSPDWNPRAETLASLVRVADKIESGKPDPRWRAGVAASAA